MGLGKMTAGTAQRAANRVLPSHLLIYIYILSCSFLTSFLCSPLLPRPLSESSDFGVWLNLRRLFSEHSKTMAYRGHYIVDFQVVAFQYPFLARPRGTVGEPCGNVPFQEKVEPQCTSFFDFCKLLLFQWGTRH